MQDLATTGAHTLQAWMREDGLRVDRVLLVTDTNYIPTGLGPAESPSQTITETIPGGLGTTTIAYSYDSLYRLTGASYSSAITATYAYIYDSVGNMTAFTETVDSVTTVVTRTFDAANRLQTALDLEAGTTSYYYDNNGNLVEILPPGATGQNPIGSLRYSYNQRNLLITHTTFISGAGWVVQAEYVYDGGNDRLRQVDYTGASPITITYTNDAFGLTQVLVADDGTMQVYNLFGLDLISQDSGSELRMLLVDGLGSVRTEMAGAVVETATTYSPYGEVLAQTGTSGTVYGFTGEQEDSATGLLYLRARYYSPQVKTFMSRDPWQGDGRRPGTLNYYTYVHGNPINLIDPSGLLYCRYSSPGCADWVFSTLNAIESIPDPLGKLLVNNLWAIDVDVKFRQWLLSGCFLDGTSPLDQRGFGVEFTDAFPALSTNAAMATRPSVIYVKTKYITPPWYTPPGPPDPDTYLLFAHELVHVKQRSFLAVSIFAEVQAYQIQASLRKAATGKSAPAGSAEANSVKIDLQNPDPLALISDLLQWQFDHADIYGIVPLLPGGAEGSFYSSPFASMTVSYYQNEFHRLFSAAPLPSPAPTPPIPPIPPGPRTPPPSGTPLPGTPPPGTPPSP